MPRKKKKTTPTKKTVKKKAAPDPIPEDQAPLEPEKILYPGVTLTMTTCKRFYLWEKTMKAFFMNCLDIDLIENIIISDDASDTADVENMKSFLKDFSFDIMVIQHRKRSHADSLNLLFESVNNDYIFHLEDDWELLEKANIIRMAFDTMKQHKKMLSVICRHWDASVKIPGTDYWMHGYNGEKYDKVNIATYPGYTLNPSLQKIKQIQEKVGNFTKEKYFELAFANKYNDAGYVVGMLDKEYFKHIGAGRNAYNLNGTNR